MSYYWLLFNHFVGLFWAFWPWHSVLSNLKLKYQICGLQPRSGESMLCTGAPGLPRKKWCMVRISENNYALIKKFSIHRPFASLREKLSVLTKVAQGCHICQGRPWLIYTQHPDLPFILRQFWINVWSDKIRSAESRNIQVFYFKYRSQIFA